MQLHNLKKNKANRKAKQVGRGGKRGKTSGRGTKGQNARSGRKKRPEMRDFIKKLPKLRGRGRNSFKSIAPKVFALNVVLLDQAFEKGEVVNLLSLSQKGLVPKIGGKIARAKILGLGPVTKPLVVEKVPVSKTAREAIELAGGKVA